jgi:hypothetical protein
MVIATVALTSPAAAEPTEVVVRTIARGAKFIGTSMGGMRVVLRDVETGAILAQGVTAGSTGDTQQIMGVRNRTTALANADAAAFRTTLDLDAPRLVEVEASGPVGQPQAATRVTARQWIVPGRHIRDGDGWLLEVPGFIVDILAPAAHVSLRSGTRSLDVRANVTMMCGCPVEPGGTWDASAYELRAIVHRNNMVSGSYTLAYAGSASQFAVALPIVAPGAYLVTVSAHDPATGNTGLDRTTFIVAP